MKLTAGNLLQNHISQACIWEAKARKAGNVHPEANFDHMQVEDFYSAAVAVGTVLKTTHKAGIGVSVLEAVKATKQVTSENINLGMILLLAPLACVTATEITHDAVRAVLEKTTVQDAELVYEAIRLANPGGLGRARRQDVRTNPTITLLDAMKLAADRDLIASEYRDCFQRCLDHSYYCIGWKQRGLEECILLSHLALMAKYGDSLIERKLGKAESMRCRKRAAEVLESGWPRTILSRQKFHQLDRWLRAKGNQRNPGATADVIAASLFIALRNGILPLKIGKKW